MGVEKNSQIDGTATGGVKRNLKVKDGGVCVRGGQSVRRRIVKFIGKPTQGRGTNGPEIRSAWGYVEEEEDE